jgi:hypothetical protein
VKIKKTAVAVAIFIILLIFAAYDARAQASIGLGYTVMNSSMTTGEIGYEYNGWNASAMVIGSGETVFGNQDNVYAYALTNIVRPNWHFLGGRNYYRIGVTYVDGSPLVGPTNFRLGIGMEWEVFALEWVHISSAGIHRPNRGIDVLQLRFRF